MAGRGRGRGRGFTFNIEQLGLSRNDVLPKSSFQQPPQQYPPLLYNPVPLNSDATQEYLLTIKRELVSAIHDSPFFVKESLPRKDVDRYSDKYQMTTITNERKLTFMDERRFPKELRPQKRQKPSKLVKSKKRQISTAAVDIEKTLAALEKNESKDDSEVEDVEEKAKNENDEEGEIQDDEYYDEEEMEEGTDYNFSYFDNGEEYIDEEEDNLDDGPVY